MADDFEDNRGQFQVGQRKRSIMLIEVLQTSCWHDFKSRCISHAHVPLIWMIHVFRKTKKSNNYINLIQGSGFEESDEIFP